MSGGEVQHAVIVNPELNEGMGNNITWLGHDVLSVIFLAKLIVI